MLALAAAPALAADVINGRAITNPINTGSTTGRKLLQDDHWCWTYLGA